MADVLTMGEWLEKRDAATPRRRSAERKTADTMADSSTTAT